MTLFHPPGSPTCYRHPLHSLPCVMCMTEEAESSPARVQSVESHPEIGSAPKCLSCIELRASLTALAATWQPIETAPHGKSLIGYTVKLPERWVRVGLGARLRDGTWLWHQDVEWGPATHWMPLPAPPTRAEALDAATSLLATKTDDVSRASEPSDAGERQDLRVNPNEKAPSK